MQTEEIEELLQSLTTTALLEASKGRENDQAFRKTQTQLTHSLGLIKLLSDVQQGIAVADAFASAISWACKEDAVSPAVVENLSASIVLMTYLGSQSRRTLAASRLCLALARVLVVGSLRGKTCAAVALSQIVLDGQQCIEVLLQNRDFLKNCTLLLCSSSEEGSAEAAVLVNNCAAVGDDKIKEKIAQHAALVGALKSMLVHGSRRQRSRAAGALMHLSHGAAARSLLRACNAHTAVHAALTELPRAATHDEEVSAVWFLTLASANLALEHEAPLPEGAWRGGWTAGELVGGLAGLVGAACARRRLHAVSWRLRDVVRSVSCVARRPALRPALATEALAAPLHGWLAQLARRRAARPEEPEAGAQAEEADVECVLGLLCALAPEAPLRAALLALRTPHLVSALQPTLHGPAAASAQTLVAALEGRPVPRLALSAVHAAAQPGAPRPASPPRILSPRVLPAPSTSPHRSPPPTRAASPPPTRTASPPPNRTASPPPTRAASPPPTRAGSPPGSGSGRLRGGGLAGLAEEGAGPGAGTPPGDPTGSARAHRATLRILAAARELEQAAGDLEVLAVKQISDPSPSSRSRAAELLTADKAEEVKERTQRTLRILGLAEADPRHRGEGLADAESEELGGQRASARVEEAVSGLVDEVTEAPGEREALHAAVMAALAQAVQAFFHHEEAHEEAQEEASPPKLPLPPPIYSSGRTVRAVKEGWSSERATTGIEEGGPDVSEVPWRTVERSVV